MNRDALRQVATVTAIVATFAVNVASVSLPIGSRTTQQISDSFDVYLIPSGPTFAIWGVIYTLLLGFAVYQALPRNRESELLRRLGWLPVWSCLFNIGWILVWQYELLLFIPALLAIVALLETLMSIHERTRGPLPLRERWLVALPFSVYFGWVTVATVLNVAVTLSSMGVEGILWFQDELVAGLVLLVAIGIAATAIMSRRDVGYGFAVLWAFNGIREKEGATPYVGDIALLGMALLGFSIVVTLIASVPPPSEWWRRIRRPAAA